MQKYKFIEGTGAEARELMEVKLPVLTTGISVMQALCNAFERMGCVGMVLRPDIDHELQLKVYDLNMKQTDFFLIKSA